MTHITATMQHETETIARPRSLTDWLEATALLHDYVEWLRAAVGVEPLVEQPSLVKELDDLSNQYSSERSMLYIARLDGMVVGMVAVRIDEQSSAELKRMYLRPVARGIGMADRLLDQAVRAARDAGCRTMWLETLPGVMDAALAVYHRNGFREAAHGRRTIGVDGIQTLERTLDAA